MGESLIRAKWIVRGVQDRHSIDLVEDGALHQRDGVIVAQGTATDLEKNHEDLAREFYL